MNNYKIHEIDRVAFMQSPMSSRLNNNDLNNDNIHFYVIQNEVTNFFFSNYGKKDDDFAPYFIQINDLLFIIFYEKVYSISLITGQLSLALALEYALVGVEEYQDELIVITDASVIRIRIDHEMCYIKSINLVFSAGGFIVDYKLLDLGVLQLIHEDSSVTKYRLSA